MPEQTVTGEFTGNIAATPENTLKPAQLRRLVAARSAADLLRGSSVLSKSAADGVSVTCLADYIIEGS